MRAGLHPVHRAVHAFGEPVFEARRSRAVLRGGRDTASDKTEPPGFDREIDAQPLDRLGINRICGG